MIHKRELVVVCAGLVVLVIGGGFLYIQQSANFATQVDGVSSVLLTHATTSTTGATSTQAGNIVTQKVTSKVGTQTTAHTSATGVAPKIAKFEPAAATVGTTVTILGTGFDVTTNYVTFGTSQGRHHTDGTADNVIAAVGSADGKTLTFTVPSSSASGLLCDSMNHCVGISAMRILPGNYPVTIKNKNGTSAIAIFSVIAQ
jgi:hypothetical protein